MRELVGCSGALTEQSRACEFVITRRSKKRRVDRDAKKIAEERG